MHSIVKLFKNICNYFFHFKPPKSVYHFDFGALSEKSIRIFNKLFDNILATIPLISLKLMTLPNGEGFWICENEN